MSKKFTVKKQDGTILFQIDADGTAILPGSLTAGAVIVEGNNNAGAINFYDQIISESITIPPGKNALSVGPITIADGVVVTVSDGSYWTIT